MQRSRSHLLAAAVAIASMGLASVSVSNVQKATPAVQPAPDARKRRQQMGGSFGGTSSGRRAAYGWTNAHARRVASKKRRIAAHKKTARRSRT